MANLVNIENIALAHGTTVVFEKLSLGVAEGDRIGVVGRNGAGKSSLLGVLTKTQDVDGGRVTHTTGLVVGVLDQTDRLDPKKTVLQAVVGDVDEYTWRSDAFAREVVTGLGVEPLLNRSTKELSGGERRRVSLAALLMRPIDVLVLDEPTNHLDVEGVAWLAEHLTGRSPLGKPRHKALLVVTHDRWFLDEVSEATWEVVDGTVYAYEGGYGSYVLARAERYRRESTGEHKRLQLAKKELAWLRRGPPARTSKPKFRIDAANAVIADVPPLRDSVSLTAFSISRLGRTVTEMENGSLNLGGRQLLDDVTVNFGPGDRIALMGVNGAGKTTLLKVLLGQQALDSGTVVRGKTIKVAYLDQTLAVLPGHLRVLEAVQEIARSVTLGKDEMSASQVLEQFGFGQSRQWTPVKDLSGGEKRRLQLLRLLMDSPNVLVLDEPTNDLDIDTLSQLEDVLDGWPGTLVVVSHDRWFLERTCDITYGLLGDGKVRNLPGGVEEYLTRRRATNVNAGTAAAGPVTAKAGGGDERATKKELNRLERQLDKLDKAEKKLQEQMAESATDYAKTAALDAELKTLQAEKESTELAWMELSDY